MSNRNGAEPVVVDVAALALRVPPESTGREIEVVCFWAFALPLIYDVGLPTAAYYVTRGLGGSAYLALLAGTLAAGLRVAHVAYWRRRLDAIAAFLLAVFGTGLALSFVTGSARLLLAKDSVPTATAGLIFLGTCLARRPLAYAWGRRIMARTAQQRRRWEAAWLTEPAFRRACYVVSLTWGCGLLCEAVGRLPLVYALPIDVMAGLSSLLSALTVSVLAAWTVWYARDVQR